MRARAVTDVFDFHGSMLAPVERFFRAFGGAPDAVPARQPDGRRHDRPSRRRPAPATDRQAPLTPLAADATPHRRPQLAAQERQRILTGQAADRAAAHPAQPRQRRDAGRVSRAEVLERIAPCDASRCFAGRGTLVPREVGVDHGREVHAASAPG